jgi:hypothetical protein
MKTIIINIILIILCLGQDIKVIKYQKLGKIKYDWYTSYELKEGFLVYYTECITGTRTNYVKNDFELITYEKYMKEKRGK